jgi:hypothetical protein
MTIKLMSTSEAQLKNIAYGHDPAWTTLSNKHWISGRSGNNKLWTPTM